MRFLFLLILSLIGCSPKSTDFDYKVALDPEWYSLSLPGREANLTAFTCELLETIASREKVSIGIYQRSWNNLAYGLQQGDYDVICTTMQPYLFYEKMYDFSQLYLMTGPVVVTSTTAPYTSLEQFKGKEVGIVQGSNGAAILEKYPEIIIRIYDTVPALLEVTADGTIDGAVVDQLVAQPFIDDLFQNRLKMITPPLTQEGLRLLSIKGAPNQFIPLFNRALARLKKDGTYATLAKKWNLTSNS